MYHSDQLINPTNLVQSGRGDSVRAGRWAQHASGAGSGSTRQSRCCPGWEQHCQGSSCLGDLGCVASLDDGHLRSNAAKQCPHPLRSTQFPMAHQLEGIQTPTPFPHPQSVFAKAAGEGAIAASMLAASPASLSQILGLAVQWSVSGALALCPCTHVPHTWP